LNWIYGCSVNNNPNILTEESARIHSITGTHKGSSNNNDVLGFDAYDTTIQFFPKGLDKIFKNLKAITINSCQLKEIYQSDLKVFPNLVYFELSFNQIEVIEEGLFKFNPHLEAVGFEESKIIHIHPNVFDHLNKLRYFWLYEIPCIDQDIWDSKVKVKEAIKVIKSNCLNSDFYSLYSQIKNIKIESKALSTKLETIEKELKNSKLSNIDALKYKFEIINNKRCLSKH